MNRSTAPSCAHPKTRRCAHCAMRDRILNDYARVCPVCGKPSQYASELDRWIHLSGEASRSCWAALSLGNTPVFDREESHV